MQAQPTSPVLASSPRATPAVLDNVQISFRDNWSRYFLDSPDDDGGSFTLSTPLEVYHLPLHGGDPQSIYRDMEPSSLSYFVHNTDGVVVGIVLVSLVDLSIQSVQPGRNPRLHTAFTRALSEIERDACDGTNTRRLYEPRIIQYSPLHFQAVWMHPVNQESGTDSGEQEAEETAGADEELVFPVIPPFPVDYLPPDHPSRFPLHTLLALLIEAAAKRNRMFAGKPNLVD